METDGMSLFLHYVSDLEITFQIKNIRADRPDQDSGEAQ